MADEEICASSEEGDEMTWKALLQKPHYIVHTPEYKKFIEATFPSVEALYCQIFTKGKLTGLFPFFHLRSSGIRKLVSSFDIFSDKVISGAFYDYGGWLGKVEDPVRIIDTLRKETGVSVVEVRGGDISLELPKLHYARFVLKLTSLEDVWNGIQKEKRKAIKKAQRSGVIVRDIRVDELPSLYRLYLHNAKVFGELPLPRRYFENFYLYFVNANLGKVLGSYVNGKMVAAVLGFTCSNRVHIKTAISYPEFRDLRVNDAVHWKFIEWSLHNGFSLFDFGRTRADSGQYSYKKKWGGDEQVLPYYFATWDSIPNVDPTNAKYKFFIWVQKHLPLWFSEHVSSRFREGLGI